MSQLSLFTLPHPTMQKFDKTRCYSKPVNYETAANIIIQYHYTKRVPSIKLAVGMYVDDVLAGVCTFGTFMAGNAAAICGNKYMTNALELTRLFVFDWCGYNSESWLIGQSFKWLEKLYPEYFILVSYADSSHNHVGYIYQATNWLYTGSSSHGHYQLADGTVIQSRSAWNPKNGETVKDFYYKNPGAKPIQCGAKHRYIYFLGNKKQRKTLLKSLRWSIKPYPKGGNNDNRANRLIRQQTPASPVESNFNGEIKRNLVATT